MAVAGPRSAACCSAAAIRAGPALGDGPGCRGGRRPPAVSAGSSTVTPASGRGRARRAAGGAGGEPGSRLPRLVRGPGPGRLTSAGRCRPAGGRRRGAARWDLWPAEVTRGGRGTSARSGGSAPIPGPRFYTSRWPATSRRCSSCPAGDSSCARARPSWWARTVPGNPPSWRCSRRRPGSSRPAARPRDSWFRVRDSEPAAGAQQIVERGPVRPRWSYFLRADTMHSLYTYL